MSDVALSAGPALAVPTTQRAPDDAAQLLHRGLGVWSVVLMVVAAAAPLGALAGLLPVILATSGGVGAPLFFLIAAVILTLFAVGFTAMSRYVPNAGAFYSYIQAGLGRHLGSGAAALALGSYMVLLIGVNAFLGVAASGALDTLVGVSVPWWSLAIASVVIAGLLGYRDIELSTKVLGLLLVAEVLVIVVVVIVIAAKGGADGLSAEPVSLSQLGVGTPSLGLMFAIFGFIGFEATAVFRHEARDPDRTIPRATYIAVIFIGLFYALASWAIIVGVGTGGAVASATEDPANFTIDVGRVFLSPEVRDLMQVLVVTSVFGVVLAFHNVVTRYQFVLARKDLLPRSLGEVSRAHNAPSKSSLVTSVVALIATLFVWLIGLDPIAETYTWLSGAATLGLIALMLLTSVAVVSFFRRRPDGPGQWQAVIAPVLAFIGLFVILALVIANFELLVGGNRNAVVIGGIIIAAFLAGLAGAEYLRRSHPDRYARLQDV